ncbi:MAG: hypothetical protein U0796_08900 [Gemmatales bacterium]
MRVFACAVVAAFLFVGCSGEPKYVSPTGSGVKPNKTVTGDKSNQKTVEDKLPG